jgi:hypothetical protein
MLFGGEGLAESRFGAVRDEAREAGVDTERRDRFAQLHAVSELLRDLVPESAEPASLDRYLEILHHCFRFWHGGCRYYAFDEAAVRSIIGDAPDLTDWSPRTDHPALYVEMPRNLCWAAVVEDEPPEPVEGLFVSPRTGRSSGDVDILVVLGIRPNRPGFSVTELAANLEVTSAIAEPDAFTSDIPGADLADLYSLQRSGEVVLLLLRMLWYIETYPEASELMLASRDADRDSHEGGSATVLDHYRVRVLDRNRG